MKEVDRMENPRTESRTIYLSDGTINLGFAMNPPVAREGLQVLGSSVKSIQEVEERLKEVRGLTYKGESPLVLDANSSGGLQNSIAERPGRHSVASFRRRLGRLILLRLAKRF